MSHPDPTKEYNEEESNKVWKEACADTKEFKDDYDSNYPPRKHKIKICYTAEMFEQFMYEIDGKINIHNIHIGSCTPNSTFQEGFIGIVYYSPIITPK